MNVPIPALGIPVDSSTPRSSSWSDMGTFKNILGLSFFASLFANTYLFDSVKLLVLGTVIETGRRLCQWLMERFRFKFSVTAQFDEGDPAYEWIVLFLTQENVWRRSKDFRVTAKSSQRKWGIKPTELEIEGNADYVPTFDLPQLFKWKGYWVEIKRSKGTQSMSMSQLGGQMGSTIYVTIYTLRMSVLSALVEEARLRYLEVSRPNVVIHMADMPSYGPAFVWNNVKHKVRRPLSSIVLEDGVIDSLLKDAREFIASEDWYIEAGIPYRRGYLLYGPPGTGKSSTIYAIAGELGLEIYSLSLSSGFVDDGFLQRAASSIPKNSILLLEDIDCAFPPREDGEEGHTSSAPNYGGLIVDQPMGMGRRSAVTLSGLLNVIDGVGSEEGKLFFATTNYIDRLDSALLRPGRIDKRIEYKLATKNQARALFLRFFPCSSLKPTDPDTTSPEKTPDIESLAEHFVAQIPPNEFSTAELQGYLLSCKKQPVRAAHGVHAWVERELGERREREEREERRKMKAREAKERREFSSFQQSAAKYGMGMGMMYPGTVAPGGFVGGGGPPAGPAPMTQPSSANSSRSLASQAQNSSTPAMPIALSASSSSSSVDGNVDDQGNEESVNVDSQSAAASPLLLLSAAP